MQWIRQKISSCWCVYIVHVYQGCWAAWLLGCPPPNYDVFMCHAYHMRMWLTRMGKTSMKNVCHRASSFMHATWISLDMQKTIDDVMSVCKQEFFSDTANDSQSPGQCKPKCSSWLTFSQSSELASKVVIGLSTVIGMLTTIMIIILSFVCFKNM